MSGMAESIGDTELDLKKQQQQLYKWLAKKEKRGIN